MITEKMISCMSSQLEVERPKKFSRKNSQSFQTIRNVSKQTESPQKLENQISTTNGNDSSIKKTTESQRFYQSQEPSLISPKKTTESLKFDIQKDRHALQYSQLKKNLQNRFQDSQIQFVRNQCKKLKLYLNEQRQKRKLAEEELCLSHIQIKRLQRRLTKYKKQKQILLRQREQMYKHVQKLEVQKFCTQNRTLNSYKLNLMEEQVRRLKEYLQKSRSERQQQLLKQIEQLNEEKYALNKQINTNYIASNFLGKQISDLDQELQQIRINHHKMATNSTQYIELRQRYKILLIEHRQMKQEMRQLMMNDSQKVSQRNIEISLLTISSDSFIAQ